MPNPKLGKTLPDVTVQLVKSFFEDDEHRRFFYLLLCNLKERFVTFKTKNPEIKIGFSRFCTYNQNAVLLLVLHEHILFVSVPFIRILNFLHPLEETPLGLHNRVSSFISSFMLYLISISPLLQVPYKGNSKGKHFRHFFPPSFFSPNRTHFKLL